MFSRSKTRWDHCRLLAVFDGAPTSFARGLARTRTENITRANLMEFEVLQCHLKSCDSFVCKDYKGMDEDGQPSQSR